MNFQGTNYPYKYLSSPNKYFSTKLHYQPKERNGKLPRKNVIMIAKYDMKFACCFIIEIYHKLCARFRF